MPQRAPLPLILAVLLTSIATLSAAATPPFHLLEAGIDDVHSALKSGRVTCRDLTQLYLKRIAAYDKSGPILNAVQTLNPEALREAEALDVAWKASGPVGPMHCIPVLVKDQVETSGLTTTYGSAVFQNFVPNRDATIVLKLKKAEAASVFSDPLARIFVDEGHSTGELREIIIVHSSRKRLLLVFYTEPEKERIRIISARSATRREQ
jgi:uncharacterized DUF497 family protein